MTILIAGGAGYIGSHTVRTLLEAGEDVAVLDDLSEGHRETVPGGTPLIEVDLKDRAATLDALGEVGPGKRHGLADDLEGRALPAPDLPERPECAEAQHISQRFAIPDMVDHLVEGGIDVAGTALEEQGERALAQVVFDGPGGEAADICCVAAIRDARMGWHAKL